MDYNIEDLSFQNSEIVTYRVRAKNGDPHTLTRLNLSGKELAILRDGNFGSAYARLLDLSHGCLRSVVDGGLDPIDKIPWIATRWWEGKLLSDQIEKKSFTGSDIARIRFHGESLIHAMGDVSGALSFDPRTIVTTRSLEGEEVTTFEFNYSTWFYDSAREHTPGVRNDAYSNLNKLIANLEEQLVEPEKTAKSSTSNIPAHEPSPTQIEAAPILKTQKNLTGSALPTSLGISQNTSPATFLVQSQDPKGANLSKVTLPTSGNSISSISENSPHKKVKLAIMISTLAIIGCSAFILMNPNASTTESTNDNNLPGDRNPKESPHKPIAEIDSTLENSSTSEPPKKTKKVFPKRPEFEGEMLDIDADSEEDLASHNGSWVVIKGRITEADDNGFIYFENSPLKAFLGEGSAEKLIGKQVNITGFLTSAKTFRIEKESDISNRTVLKKFYTIDDEAFLRTLTKKTVKVRALVKGFSQSPWNGKSLYLVFDENTPGFLAGISPDKSGSNIDEEWLRQFIGKEIQVTGKVSTNEETKDRSGKRLVIRFYDKKNIKLVD